LSLSLAYHLSNTVLLDEDSNYLPFTIDSIVRFGRSTSEAKIIEAVIDSWACVMLSIENSVLQIFIFKYVLNN
jgi:hypothetical protein